MDSSPPPDVTQLLLDWRRGDPQALEELLPLVYDELHRLGRRYMAQEGAGHTLQPTALVHEAYLHLVDQQRVKWQSRAHFFAVAATLMRRVLLHHAERKHAAKRGGKLRDLTLDEVRDYESPPAVDLLSLDRALQELSALDERQGRIVELKFFAGFKVEEIAHVLEVSTATVKREWRMARAWLRHRLEGASDIPSTP